MIQSIPLKKLVPSPRNVRKSSDVLADLQLRADIAARGLLQNLVVRKGKRGKFEVEAGGRRLAALQALAEESTLPENHEVTCLVIEGEESEVREASLAENFQRLAMNPADEAQAFASIIEAGATTEDVARRFGLTVRFVVSVVPPCDKFCSVDGWRRNFSQDTESSMVRADWGETGHSTELADMRRALCRRWKRLLPEKAQTGGWVRKIWKHPTLCLMRPKRSCARMAMPRSLREASPKQPD